MLSSITCSDLRTDFIELIFQTATLNGKSSEKLEELISLIVVVVEELLNLLAAYYDIFLNGEDLLSDYEILSSEFPELNQIFDLRGLIIRLQELSKKAENDLLGESEFYKVVVDLEHIVLCFESKFVCDD